MAIVNKIIVVWIFFMFGMANIYADDSRMYTGVLGNKSTLTFEDNGQDISNGELKSNEEWSLTFGYEYIFDEGMLRPTMAYEIFYEGIYHTIIQGDKDFQDKRGRRYERPLNNTEVLESKYIAGFRFKPGLKLFDRVNIYGQLGLCYWRYDSYMPKQPDEDHFLGDYFPISQIISPLYGMGMSIDISKYLGVNINYTRLYGVLLRNLADTTLYIDNDIHMSIDMVTIGAVIYF